MKTISLLFSLGMMLGVTSLEAKETEQFTKNITVQESIGSSQRIQISNRYGDVSINTWNQDAVKVVATIEGATDEADELSKLYESLEESIIQLKDYVYISTPVSKYQNSNWVFGNRSIGKSELVLTNGKKFDIADFKMQLNITIPDGHELSVSTKYHDLEIASYNGRASIDHYNGDLKLGTLGSESRVAIKYGSVEVLKADRLSLSIYDSRLKIASVNDLSLTSKYSDIALGDLRKLKVSSFDDEITMGNAEELTLSAKYSELTANDIASVRADLYEGELDMRNARAVLLNAKYADISIESVEEFTMGESYDNDISIGRAGGVSVGSSKYSDVSIDELTGSLTATSYDDDWEIDLVKSSVSTISITAQYGDVEITVEDDWGHALKATLRYGDLDFDKGHYNISIENDADTSYTLSAATRKGSGGSISLSGYSTDFDISVK